MSGHLLMGVLHNERRLGEEAGMGLGSFMELLGDPQ